MSSNMGGVAVVTGASSALGKAIVGRLSSKHGMRIACITRSRHRGATELPPHCSYVTADVCQSRECNEAMRAITSTLGGVSLFIHAAGCNTNKLLVRCTDEDYDTVMNTNVRGAVNMTRAVLRYGGMLLPLPPASDDGVRGPRRDSGKSVLYIGSVVGSMGNTGQVLYAASKAALSGMTRSLAQEYSGKDIRFNVVAPGLICAPHTKETSEGGACLTSSATCRDSGVDHERSRMDLSRHDQIHCYGADAPVGMARALTPEQLEQWRRRCPLRRLATVEDVVDVVVGVAFARYINGQTIAVDGGISLG